jgi:hypothetical protein
MEQRFYVLGLALVMSASGCGGDSAMCGEIYDKFKECWVKEMEEHGADESDRDRMPNRKQFVGFCEAAEGDQKEMFKEMHRCSKEADCDARKECEDEVEAARRNKEKLEDIAGHMKKEDWQKAYDECKYATDDYKESEKLEEACEEVFATAVPKLLEKPEAMEDLEQDCQYRGEVKDASPAFAKACADAATGMLEAKKTAAQALRDKGEDDYSTCSRLKELAATVGGDAQTQAEALCNEVSAAPRIKSALDSAKAAISSRSTSVPYDCTYALSSLDSVQPETAWAKARREELVRTCWVEIGKIAIETYLPAATQQNYCTWEITQVRSDAATYKLAGKDAAFDDLLAKTDAMCGPRADAAPAAEVAPVPAPAAIPPDAQ